MALLDRLLGLEEDNKIAVHQFTAAMAEFKRGEITIQQLGEAFELTSQEQTQLQTFIDNYDTNSLSRSIIHDALLLGEGGHYTKTRVKNRLGL